MQAHESREELLAQLNEVKAELTRGLSARHMAPFLELDITAQQLKTVFLVTTGTVTTVSQAAEQLGVAVPTASASIDKLVENGLLTRTEGKPDRRIRHLTATRKAIRLHERFLGLRTDTDEFAAHLSDEELQGLVIGFRGIRRVLRQFSEGA
ncbi:MarR family transcriptional regulator [Pseudoclavibacter helvolus]|uniref:MarR family transcriptional regulator n=1 Tax=Pseudoclavibacter helvolus TaxID=255205 RepID=UPI003734E66E